MRPALSAAPLLLTACVNTPPAPVNFTRIAPADCVATFNDRSLEQGGRMELVGFELVTVNPIELVPDEEDESIGVLRWQVLGLIDGREWSPIKCMNSLNRRLTYIGSDFQQHFFAPQVVCVGNVAHVEIPYDRAQSENWGLGVLFQCDSQVLLDQNPVSAFTFQSEEDSGGVTDGEDGLDPESAFFSPEVMDLPVLELDYATVRDAISASASELLLDRGSDSGDLEHSR